eukprot:TRINITY_DN955_c0_g1_i2.p1 TRINITY_DN955_c0_g1~~TRINITY_DN955_c0_g1_i2.p1  ORF type:complete len:1220 (+),score=270.34 TRINITY_DN955_c0_g1_i2:48-3707(+)
MASKKFNITETLDKLANRDPDFRYMALSDLIAELEKDTFKMDVDSEKKICASIIKLLDDSSGDVQGLTVKCLGPLVTRIKEKNLEDIIDTLGDYVKQNKKENLRDIAGIGLKTVTNQIDIKNASLIIDRVTPKLLEGINSGEKPVILETLGVLCDLLKRFSTQMNQDHEKIQTLILPQLTSTTPATRKRAIACLGYLSISTPDKLFAQLVSHVLKGIQKSKKGTHIQTLISVIGAISRSVGYRLGKFLESEGIIDLLIKYLNDEQFQEDSELKDNCFQTFESLVLRCPKEIRPYLDAIIEQCLKYIQWDPNYAGLSGDEDEDEFDDFDDEEFSAEDYSDDDDMSWKVRRSAAKCLASVITTRPDMLGQLYSTVIPTIIARFKEREENVKLDIFDVFNAALKQSVTVSRGMSDTAEDNPVNLLKKSMPDVVANLKKELSNKSVKIKTGVFNLLKEIVSVRDGLLSDKLGDLVPGIKEAFAGKTSSSNLKIEVLSFLSLVIATHSAAAFQPHVAALSDPILSAVSQNYYKISAAALRVCRGLITVIRPHGESSFDFKPYPMKIYEAIFKKYEAQDIDQEVKDAAIACVGALIAHMGDSLPEDKLQEALTILLDRIKNEITRLTSVNVLIEIAVSPLNVDVKSILADAVSELADYLRQTNRQLKQACLKALDTVTRSYGKGISSKLYQKVLKEASALIGETDLHMSYLSLRLTAAVVKAEKKSLKVVQSQVYPRMLTLVQSSLLQGLALEALFDLYGTLVTFNYKNFGFDQLFKGLLGLQLKSSAQSTRQSQTSIAQCVAALVLNSEENRESTINKFIDEVKKSKSATQRVQALLCLGEIGRRSDLSGFKNVQTVILSAFDGNEDERNAASFCLGCVSVGNVQKFLPFLLEEIKKVEPNKQYLLIHSLKEIISLASASEEGRKALVPHLEAILALLFENTESEEEGTRNVVAECLGKFTLISPEQLVPALKERQSSKSAKTRATVVTALKFAVVERPHAVDAHLAPIMGGFLGLLADTDLATRKASLLTLNYAAHNKPALVRPVLGEYLEHLYEETKMKKELITIVTLGPFKHKVDTGLENRKAAFECMYTLLETCIDKIEISTFVEHLKNGLTDVYDIKLLCYLMLVRLAKSAGAAMITSLDSLVVPLKKTLTARVRESAVQQEKEKNEELVRSACRAIASISLLSGVDSAIKFNEFVETTVIAGKHAQKYEEILQQLKQQ